MPFGAAGAPYSNHYDHYDPYQTEEEQGIKYTCRYDIQIENESVFQVARRVIGSKGANMKRIIEECSQGFAGGVNPYEIVKLRLRGKGSGFKEGPSQVESEDPLNICISSKYREKYDYACSEMDRLLVKVYEEFKQFYRNKAKKPYNYYQELKVKKHETITRPKSYLDGEEQYDEEESVAPYAQNQAGSNPVVNQQIKASITQIMDQNSQAHQFGQQPFYAQQHQQMPSFNSCEANQIGNPVAPSMPLPFNPASLNPSGFQIGLNQYFNTSNHMPQPYYQQNLSNHHNMSSIPHIMAPHYQPMSNITPQGGMGNFSTTNSGAALRQPERKLN